MSTKRTVAWKFCAVCVSLWAAVVACSQEPPSAALPAALRDPVKNGRFMIATSIKGLPLGVRNELTTLFGMATLDIAEPGAPFQTSAGNAGPKLPLRRLAAAGCEREYCLVYYERGGDAHTWHVALFHWTPSATRFEWGGIAPGGLATIDDVRNAVLSGAVKNTDAPW